jgi:CDP-paratose 2-epimerase
VLHVDDLVDLLLLEIEMLDEINGETFNVGGGRGVSMSLRELTALCQAITANRIEISRVEKERRGDIPWYISDISKIQERLCWKPKRDMLRIVTDTVRWIQENEEMLKPFLAS